MYNCPVRWYTVVNEMSVDEMSVDEMSVDELSWNHSNVYEAKRFFLLCDVIIISYIFYKLTD